MPCESNTGGQGSLSELERATLELWTDRHPDLNFWQHLPEPPAEVVRLRDRYLAQRSNGRPPADPPVVATTGAADDGPWRKNGPFDELLRLEVRIRAVLVGLVLAILIGLVLTLSTFIAALF